MTNIASSCWHVLAILTENLAPYPRFEGSGARRAVSIKTGVRIPYGAIGQLPAFDERIKSLKTCLAQTEDMHVLRALSNVGISAF